MAGEPARPQVLNNPQPDSGGPKLAWIGEVGFRASRWGMEVIFALTVSEGRDSLEGLFPHRVGAELPSGLRVGGAPRETLASQGFWRT